MAFLLLIAAVTAVAAVVAVAAAVAAAAASSVVATVALAFTHLCTVGFTVMWVADPGRAHRGFVHSVAVAALLGCHFILINLHKTNQAAPAR